MSEDLGISVFLDKEQMPDDDGLKQHLDKTFDYWKRIREYVLVQYPKGEELWSYFSKKYGWSYRIKDKRRAIIYLSPRAGYFLVTMVFGFRAVDHIVATELDPWIRDTLKNSKAFPEGKVIRIPVKDESWLDSIEALVKIKLAF